MPLSERDPHAGENPEEAKERARRAQARVDHFARIAAGGRISGDSGGGDWHSDSCHGQHGPCPPHSPHPAAWHMAEVSTACTLGEVEAAAIAAAAAAMVRGAPIGARPDRHQGAEETTEDAEESGSPSPGGGSFRVRKWLHDGSLAGNSRGMLADCLSPAERWAETAFDPVEVLEAEVAAGRLRRGSWGNSPRGGGERDGGDGSAGASGVRSKVTRGSFRGRLGSINSAAVKALLANAVRDAMAAVDIVMSGRASKHRPDVVMSSHAGRGRSMSRCGTLKDSAPARSVSVPGESSLQELQSNHDLSSPNSWPVGPRVTSAEVGFHGATTTTPSSPHILACSTSDPPTMPPPTACTPTCRCVKRSFARRLHRLLCLAFESIECRVRHQAQTGEPEKYLFTGAVPLKWYLRGMQVTGWIGLSLQSSLGTSFRTFDALYEENNVRRIKGKRSIEGGYRIECLSL